MATDGYGCAVLCVYTCLGSQGKWLSWRTYALCESSGVKLKPHWCSIGIGGMGCDAMRWDSIGLDWIVLDWIGLD